MLSYPFFRAPGALHRLNIFQNISFNIMKESVMRAMQKGKATNPDLKAGQKDVSSLNE